MSVNTANAKGGEFATSRRGGMTAYEVDFIRDQRAKGRSVQTIAHMLGRSRECVGAYIDATEQPSVCAPLKPKQPPKIPEAAMAVIENVARRHGFVAWDIVPPSRSTKIKAARHECFARLRDMRKDDGGYRYGSILIGEWFGCNHGTVLTGVSYYEKRVAREAAEQLERWQQLGKVA